MLIMAMAVVMMERRRRRRNLERNHFAILQTTVTLLWSSTR